MQRSFILLLLSLVSVTFLWLQISVFNNIEHSRKDFGKLIPKFMRRGWASDNRNVKKGLLSLLRDFHEACAKYRITPFIIDPSTLQSILREQQGSNTKDVHESEECRHFCYKRSISLGVLATYWNRNVLNEMQKKEIKFISVTGQDPRLIDLNGTTPHLIPLHFFFTRHQFVIHVVVLYEREVLELWHGPISQQDLLTPDIFTHNKEENTLSSYEHFKNESVLDRFSSKVAIIDGLSVRLPSEIALFLRDLEGSRFLPCNLERAKAFYLKYGDDESEQAKVFRKRGRDVLQIAKIILDNLGVRFWLSSGTCLGWFRQCNVISHGMDMDIGIWIKDYNGQLIEEFQKDGLYLHHIFGKIEDSFQMSFRTIDGIKLDIFFFYEEGEHMWNGGTQAKSGKKFKYIFPNFSLCWTEFLKMKVRVPCETQAYIEANYGKSWAVPIKKWDWKKSPSNVIENGMWDAKDLPEVIQFFELQ